MIRVLTMATIKLLPCCLDPQVDHILAFAPAPRNTWTAHTLVARVAPATVSPTARHAAIPMPTANVTGSTSGRQTANAV